jgi:hypothetical protein
VAPLHVPACCPVGQQICRVAVLQLTQAAPAVPVPHCVLVNPVVTQVVPAQQPVQLAALHVATATHCPLTQVWVPEQLDTQVPVAVSHLKHNEAAHGAARQTLPQTRAVGQHCPPMQTSLVWQHVVPQQTRPLGKQVVPQQVSPV